MKKPDTELELTKTEKKERPNRPSKRFSMPSVLKKNPKAAMETDTTSNSSAEQLEDATETPRKRINITYKQIFIVLGISLLTAILLIFIFDLTGWRSSLRDNLTTQLLGKEKEVLITRLEFEYDQKLKIVKEETLKEERAMLVTEYQELESKKADFETRMSRLENSERVVEQYKIELEVREKQLVENIENYEQGIIEISELSKIYQAMEPKNAAKILSLMNNEVQIVKILKIMKTDSVAAILELMETQKAADILSKLN